MRGVRAMLVLSVWLSSVTGWNSEILEGMGRLQELAGGDGAGRARRLGTSPSLIIEREHGRALMTEDEKTEEPQVMIEREILRGGSTFGAVLQGSRCRTSPWMSAHLSVFEGRLQQNQDRASVKGSRDYEFDCYSSESLLSSDKRCYDAGAALLGSESPVRTYRAAAQDGTQQSSCKKEVSVVAGTRRESVRKSKEKSFQHSTPGKKARPGESPNQMTNPNPGNSSVVIISSENRTGAVTRAYKKANGTIKDGEFSWSREYIHLLLHRLHHGHVNVQKGCRLGCQGCKEGQASRGTLRSGSGKTNLLLLRHPSRPRQKSTRQIRVLDLQTRQHMRTPGSPNGSMSYFPNQDDVWEKQFQEMLKFKARFGHCNPLAVKRRQETERELHTGNVPYKGKLRRLGCWVFNQVKGFADKTSLLSTLLQRILQRRGLLSPNRWVG
eukprot:755962-Hanusia_phi.AAC.6